MARLSDIISDTFACVESAQSVASEIMWSVSAIDFAMISMACFLFYALWKIVRNDFPGTPTEKHKKREELERICGVVGIFAATFIAYGTLRNQLRLTAKVSLNQEGQDILEYEMSDEGEMNSKRSNYIRCIYDNYGFFHPNECLDYITSNEDRWSKAIFYVEEAYFVLKKAHKDKRQWGSNYGQDINYWADDVSRDPTGLFSYYAVSSEGSVPAAKKMLKESGVCIPNICQGYTRVRQMLKSNMDRRRAVQCTTVADQHAGRMRCESPN